MKIGSRKSHSFLNTRPFFLLVSFLFLGVNELTNSCNGGSGSNPSTTTFGDIACAGSCFFYDVYCELKRVSKAPTHPNAYFSSVAIVCKIGPTSITHEFMASFS
jgi:hypothetical protein